MEIQIAHMPGGWWWLVLVRDGRVLDVLDKCTHRSQAETRKAEFEAQRPDLLR